MAYGSRNWKRVSNRRKTFKKTPRRGTRKLAVRASNTAQLGWGNIIGKRAIASMSIAALFTLQPTAGSVDFRPITANWSLNNPVYSGGGQGAPRGYDQLRALYGQYSIIGSRCRVKYIIDPTAEIETPVVGLTMVCSGGNGSMVTIDDYKENKFSKMKILTVGAQSGRASLNLNYSPKKVLGKKMELDLNLNDNDNNDYQYEYRVFAFTANEAVAMDVPITCQVTVDYRVVFHSPIQPPNSS